MAIFQFLYAMVQPRIIELQYIKLRQQIDPNWGFDDRLGFMSNISSQWEGEKIFAILLLILAIIWRFLENRSDKQSKTPSSSN